MPRRAAINKAYPWFRAVVKSHHLDFILESGHKGIGSELEVVKKDVRESDASNDVPGVHGC